MRLEVDLLLTSQATRHSVPGERTAAKVAGTFQYLTDLKIEDCLFAAAVRSPYPHAELVAIDTRALKRLPGVVAVFTYADVPGARFNPAAVPPDSTMEASADKRILSRVARHVGDSVAVVVAESRDEARAAARNAPTTWRELPATLSIDDGVPLGKVTIEDERVPALLDGSDVVVQEAFTFAAAQHSCLETHACAAVPLGDGLELWTNTQCPVEVRRLVGSVLGIDRSAIRMRKVDEGGGFGGKQDMFEEALVGWLALTLGRPVRLIYTRDEELTAGRVRSGGRIEVQLGFDRSGRLRASDTTAVLDSGAYASHTPFVLSCIAGHLSAVYLRAAHRFNATAVRTNTIPAGAYRGYGVAEANFAVEQAMDVAAERLGMRPHDIRMRNVSPGVAKCLETLTSMTHEGGSRSADAWHGVGLAVATKHSVTGPGDTSTAEVRLMPGPSVLLTTGTCDSGTGSSAALAALVAEELDLPVEVVAVQEGDSGRGLMDIGSTAQRSLFVGGRAARHAARSVRDQLGGTAPADVNHVVTARAGVGGSGHGASHCAVQLHVAVNPTTGHVTVTNALAAVDCGKVVNMTGARGQVVGGIAQGIGLACYDLWEPSDRGRGPGGLQQHGVLGALDMPAVAVRFSEHPGAEPSGLGELPIVPVAAAVANGVADAAGRGSGRRCRRTPMRPADVWREVLG